VIDETIQTRQAFIFHNGKRIGDSVKLVREGPLTLFVDGEELVTLLCTGQFPEDLAIGFLRSEGIIDFMEDVTSVRADGEQGAVWIELRESRKLRQALLHKRTLGAGCGRASLYFQPLDGIQITQVGPGPRLTHEEVHELMREMSTSGNLYKDARATHAAALAEPGKMIIMREDIGRHNAVDMIVGNAMRNGIRLDDKLLLTTGRASSEIVLKAARVGIPMVVSRSAATLLGVEVAEKVGMTLIGSVRGGKMTIYTHPHRIIS